MTDPREQARESVRAAFAKGPAGPPVRRCRSCGAENATERAYCPACGKRYDRRLPWLSDRARVAVAVAGAVAAVTAAALILPGVFENRDAKNAAKAAAQRALEARERARLAKEQAPHRGEARHLRDTTLAARLALIGALETDILVDARARIARDELDGPVREVTCGPLIRDRSARPDHEDLGKRVGRYDCVAIKADVVQEGKVVAALGHPFIAAVDFRRFTYVWCKDNKKPGERGKPLAVVPLDPACLAAEGQPRIGSGYAAPEDD